MGAVLSLADTKIVHFNAGKPAPVSKQC